MLTVPPTTKLWFASAVDLRLGFDGLSQLVRTQLSADPLSGHLFVFTNRSANRVKVLVCVHAAAAREGMSVGDCGPTLVA